jgi:hypothetical protein
VLFTAIFLGSLVVGWLFCAFVPWLALSVVTRGNAGLINLPICLFAGIVAAVAVPLLGMTEATGLWLSFAVAAAAPALLLAVRRFSMTSAGSNTSRSKVVEEAQPK